MLFKEIFGFHCESHSKDMHTVFDKVHESHTVAVDCQYSYHLCVNGQTKLCLIQRFCTKF